MCTVMKLYDAGKYHYSCDPKMAVIAAYAQSLGDFNTWDYDKYNNLVEEGELTFFCGDFSSFKDGREF